MKKIKVATVIPVAALALAACGGGATDGQGGGGEERQVSTAETTAPPAPAQGAAQVPANGGKAAASREFQSETLGTPVPMRLDITGLQRQGQLATLNFTITNKSGEKFWMPHQSFADRGHADPTFDVSGITLVDPQNAKRYRVARSGGSPEGPCVCSETRGISVAKGGTASFYATFPAPPAGLSAINVEIPLVGVINDVPLS